MYTCMPHTEIWPFVRQSRLGELAEKVTIAAMFWKEDYQGKALFKVK